MFMEPSAWLWLQVVEAIDHAHAAGQVHGDHAPHLPIYGVQRRVHHELVQVLRLLLQMTHILPQLAISVS